MSELTEIYKKALELDEGKNNHNQGGRTNSGVARNKSGMTKKERKAQTAARLKADKNNKQNNKPQAQQSNSPADNSTQQTPAQNNGENQTPNQSAQDNANNSQAENQPANNAEGQNTDNGQDKDKSQQKEENQENSNQQNNQEGNKETDNSEEMDDADIDEETRQNAATEIVTKRVNYFNKRLADLYRIAGNLVAHKSEVFTIFDAKPVEAKPEEKPSTPPENDKQESFNNSEYTIEMLKHIKLFEADNQEENDAGNKTEPEKKEDPNAKVELEVALSKKMGSNKFTESLSKLAKALKVDGFDSQTNIGKLCSVTGALMDKYSELNKNMPQVNKNIQMDKIQLDSEAINMNINNALLKQLYQFFKGTPGESALLALNYFCSKNISNISSSTSISKLIEQLPTKVKEVSSKLGNGESFKLSIPKKVYDNANFPKVWFNIAKQEQKENKPADNKKEPPTEDKSKTPADKNETDIDKSKNKEGANPSEQSDTEQNSKK